MFAPHNQFLGVWLDNGLGGVLLFALGMGALFVSAFRRNLIWAVGVGGLILQTVVSHNLLESKPFLVTWILLATSTNSRRAEREQESRMKHAATSQVLSSPASSESRAT